MAELWVLDNQLGRRNITQEERLALALQYHTKEVAVTNTLKAQKAGEQSQKSQQVVEKKESNSVDESSTKLEQSNQQVTRPTRHACGMLSRNGGAGG